MENNQPMELKFKLTPQDYWAWGKHFRASRQTKLKRVLQVMIGVSMAALFAAMDRFPASSISLTVLATTVFWVAVVLVMANLQRKNMFDEDGYMLAETVYRMEEAGLRALRPQADMLHMWASIQAIEQSPQHIFLRIDRSIAIVFPKRIFASDAIREAFIAEVRFRAKWPEVAAPPPQKKTGSEALTALAVGYFIAAGIMAFFTLSSGFFNAEVQSAMPDAFAGGNADEQWILQMFFYGSWIVWALELALTLLFLLTGFNMLRRKSRKLCLVAAALVCPVFPVGTILGVFTFVALLRPEIKAEFDAAAHSTPA